jgi:hypothetical protein
MADPTKEEMEAMMASVIQAPKFYGSTVNVNMTSNEISLMFGRPHFVIGDHEGAPGEPVAIIQMSPQTAKDLLVLLAGSLKTWEKEWGELQTEFTRRQK